MTEQTARKPCCTALISFFEGNAMKCFVLLVATFLSLVSLTSNATVVDFEDNAAGVVGAPYDVISQGFFFDFVENSPDEPVIAGSGSAPNGTSMYALCGHCNATSEFEFFDQAGDVFSLSSFEVGVWGPALGQEYDLFITGSLSGGGSVVKNVSGITSLQTISFDTNLWSDLDSVYIVTTNINNDSISSSVYDNFNVNVVPIPAAVWLFGSALAGLGWMRRRKSLT
jgi:hypothetical protein